MTRGGRTGAWLMAATAALPLWLVAEYALYRVSMQSYRQAIFAAQSGDAATARDESSGFLPMGVIFKVTLGCYRRACIAERIEQTLEASGSLRWRAALGVPVKGGAAPDGDGNVWIGDNNGNVYAIAVSTGAIEKVPVQRLYSWGGAGVQSQALRADRWLHKLIYPMQKEGETYDPFRAIETVPAMAGGRMIFAGHRRMFAVDVTARAVQWSSMAAWAESSPAVTADRVVYGDESASVLALDARTGRYLWSAKMRGAVEAPVWIDGDSVWAGSQGGELARIDLSTGEVQWRTPVAGIEAGIVVRDGLIYAALANGEVQARFHDTPDRLAWKTPLGAYIESTPVVAGNILAVAAADGCVHALGAEDGILRWKFCTVRRYEADLAADGKTIYAGAHDGSMTALDAATGHVRWRFWAANTIYESRPMLADGVVVFGGTDGMVYALRTRLLGISEPAP